MRIDGLSALEWRLKEFLPSGWVRPDVVDVALGDEQGWIAAAVPGSVQRAVVAAGLAPDPYVGRGSVAGEWIADRTWVYHCRFAVDPAAPGERRILRLGGIDYEARIVLNGTVLGTHEGTAVGSAFDVTELVVDDAENDLVIVLAPAPREQDQMGRTSLVTSRKPRMGYWWDFCPRLIDLGITGAVTLEASTTVLEEVAVAARLDATRTLGTVDVEVRFGGRRDLPVAVRIERDGAVVASADGVGDGSGATRLSVDIRQPDLWWPNGVGEPALYRVHVAVGDATATRTIGFRHIELQANDDSEPDAPPYVFVVNGRRIYIAGWNWVPFDALSSDPQPAKLRHLLDLAARSNANLLRVNGVGPIASDEFFEECDRLGLLVWQEFTLTSSATDRTPSADPSYIDAVVAEGEAAVRRIRHHPSLAVWCAGNELESPDRLPLDDSTPIIGALKEVATRLDPDTVWLPTSARGRKPFNGPNSIREDPHGLQDVHGPWLYQGVEDHYALYNAGTSMFHSEIGAEAITNTETARQVLGEDEWSADRMGSAVWRHLTAWWTPLDVWRERFGRVDDLDRLVAASQLVQAEAVRYAVESNRRRAFRNAGSLLWQFDEPFPMVGSTAGVDFHGRPKPLFAAIRAAFAPTAVSARYDRMAWGGRDVADVELWTVSALGSGTGTLTARAWGADGTPLASAQFDVDAPENIPTRAGAIDIPLRDAGYGVVLLELELRDGTGILAENRMVFSTAANLAPLMDLPATSIVAEWTDGRAEMVVRNDGAALACGVRIADGREPGVGGWVLASDDHLMLRPGEERRISLDWRDVPEGERTLRLTGLNSRALDLD